jgi:hypothetical protein
MSYPVRITVVPAPPPRNRLTVAFRLILAIPHTILAGPVIWIYRTGSLGLLGAAAYFLAIVNWCGLIFAGREAPGVRDFQMYYLRWRTRSVAYSALLTDAYPPFGDALYPASITVNQPLGARDRGTIALRLLYAVPQLVVLFFVLLAWLVATIVAWFAILFTSRHPAGLREFGIGAMRWLLRVEAYVLLLVDEYPPFSLQDDPRVTSAEPEDLLATSGGFPPE